ncbi:hypothetical protein GGR88_001692 [Sphingomonas jejuensis]|uniref:Uncharacterized protein n=1 Tax=Sphingomonas jejuensis TaxID=904715 RepID=A0ABX0XLH4_9SPHN|nr:hypothetical protein [Sphingomonas jejuensis]NJC34218.1 hypothetical protein [Sphingomonas jejuensis]
MRSRWSAALIGAAMIATASAATAHVPCPPFAPGQGFAPQGGYEMNQLYYAWKSFIDGKRLAAAWRVWARDHEPGFHNPGALISMTSPRYAAVMESCAETADPLTAAVPQDCRLRFVEAIFPWTCTDQALSTWARNVFDPEALARRMADQRIDPSRLDRGDAAERLFSVLPDPTTALIEHGRTVAISSKDCPALLAEVLRIDQAGKTMEIDFPSVRTGSPSLSPYAHAPTYSIEIDTATSGGTAVIRWSGANMWPLVDPVFTAADRCAAEMNARRD